MRKRYGYLAALICSVFIVLTLFTGSKAYAAVDETHPGFRVDGRFLYDNQGEKTTLYGINKMVVWLDKDGSKTFHEIAKTGANCVRIVWTMKDGTAEELDTAITNCRAEHMIPIVELHDATGEFDKLQSLVDWWTDPATVNVIKKHQDYLLVNIGNEVGNGNVSDDTFKAGYIKAVTRMREAGIHVPLLIDGSSWGQDINKLQACGPDIIKADPDANLMFSAHLWWPYMYGHTADEVAKELQESADMNLPLVVGEFANQWEETEQGQIPYKTIMEYCSKLDIGYLIWSWGPGNSPQTFLDMTTDGTLDTMQDWAKEMVYTDDYALSKIVKRPASMLDGTKPVPTPQVSSISVSEAKFDIAAPEDVDVSLTLNGNEFTGIKNGDYTLVEGQDYTIDGTDVVLSKDYIKTLGTGKKAFKFVFSAGPKAELTLKVTDSSKVPTAGDIKILLSNGNLNKVTNYTSFKFKITNTASEAVDLSDLKLRYYFTTDGVDDNNFWCDWTQVGNANVNYKFVKMDSPTDTADCYLEISFSEAAGKLEANNTIDLQCRTARSNWSNFNQENDYSFNGETSNYEEWNNVTAYVNDKLVSGMEP